MASKSLQRLVTGDRPERYARGFAGTVGDVLVRLNGKQSEIILLTAPQTRAGTTFVAFGLATGLCAKGVSVLLIDANERHASLTELLGLGGRPGFRDYARTGDVPDLVKPSAHYPELSVMGVGVSAGGGGVLTRATMAGLDRFDALRKRFACVLVDTAPVVNHFETQLLAEQADHSLLVVRQGHTTLTTTAEAKQALADRKSDCWGVVMNRHRLPYPACLEWLITG